MDQERTDELAETLGRLEVADTLEDLRLNIDALIERLAAARSEEAGVIADVPPADPSPPAGFLDQHLDDLGQKVEGATDLLAELTDLLESQSERIETIEQQLGDPDVVSPPPRPEPVVTEPAAAEPLRPQPSPPELSGVEAFAIAEVLRDLKFWLDDRFDRIDNAVSRLDQIVAEVRDLGAEGDRRVRELEDRLLILVDSGLGDSAVEPAAMRVPVEASAPYQTVELGAVGPGAMELGAGTSVEAVEPRVVTGPPLAQTESAPPLKFRHRPSPAQQMQPVSNFSPARELESGSTAWDEPMDGTAARRLEELVEREVQLQQSFVPGAEIPPSAQSVRSGRKRPTVMVVDDSADARTILSIYLSKTGYQVVTAASAEDCLAKLRHHAVDAVILDSSMPGGGGAHVCRVLRDDPLYRGARELPIIVYTAHPEAFSRDEAAALGATDYVIKSGDLLPLITSLVSHTKTQGR